MMTLRQGCITMSILTFIAFLVVNFMFTAVDMAIEFESLGNVSLTELLGKNAVISFRISMMSAFVMIMCHFFKPFGAMFAHIVMLICVILALVFSLMIIIEFYGRDNKENIITLGFQMDKIRAMVYVSSGLALATALLHVPHLYRLFTNKSK